MKAPNSKSSLQAKFTRSYLFNTRHLYTVEELKTPPQEGSNLCFICALFELYIGAALYIFNGIRLFMLSNTAKHFQMMSLDTKLKGAFGYASLLACIQYQTLCVMPGERSCP